MARLASLRNRIAHSYGDLDVVRMVRELPVVRAKRILHG
jgi:uncharacterized protein YutE (UPF0331/DUF86 family)